MSDKIQAPSQDMALKDSLRNAKGIVLVVDDEPYIADSIRDVLELDGYDVVIAANGQNALELYKKYDFNFVISDIRMPELTGDQFFLEAFKIKKRPFLLMTGYSEIMDLDKAYQMGVTEFIMKPFSHDDLISSVRLIEYECKSIAHSGVGSEELTPTPDSSYCRIHIDDFLTGSHVHADIFLKLGANKYLRVAKQDSPMSNDRIKSYKKKGLEYFYIRNIDFANYVGFNLKLANAVSKKRTIPKHKKLSVLKHTLEVVVQDVYINGMNKEKFNDAKGLMESTINCLFESKDIFMILDMLKSHHDKIYAHSMAVSLYAVAVAQSWGWNSSTSLFKISMSGLFHDIGIKEFSEDLVSKKRTDMTPDEIRLYETHPIRAEAILNGVPGIPEEVIRVAAEHHETPNGLGYPRGINRLRIHPIAKIIHTVDEFCYLVLSQDSVSMEVHAALDHLYRIKRDELDPHTLKGLMQIFDYPIPSLYINLTAPKATS